MGDKDSLLFDKLKQKFWSWHISVLDVNQDVASRSQAGGFQEDSSESDSAPRGAGTP